MSKALVLAPVRLIQAMFRALSPFWVTWVFLLFLVHFVAPLWFLDEAPAQWMLGAALTGFAILVVMNETMGMTRLMGVAHVPWIIPMGMIYRALSSGAASGASGPYASWLWAAAVVGTICLLIDLVDVVRFTRGEREPL